MEKSLQNIDYLFSPRSVAIIGASNNPDKWGFDIMSRMVWKKTSFTVYPINPKEKEIFGLPAYARLTDVPADIDFSVIVIPPEHIAAAMKDCVAKKIKSVLIITAGFKETGGAGTELESEVVRIARTGGIRVVGPNCNGHFSTSSGLFTTGREDIKSGPVGIISQSGNFGGYIVRQGTERGVGFSKYVSSGNEADLTIEDYIEYLAEDEDTKIICAYIEGLKDGRRFFDLAKQVTRKKPIIVLKAGRSPEGASAAMSHTASLSGSDEIHDAAFKQTGVIRVDTVDDMVDVASALIQQPLPQNNRVGIVTVGGGFGVVAADACLKLGLKVPSLSEETIERLNRILPPRWSHANPVDMAGTVQSSYGCIGNIMKTDGIDAVLVISCIGYVPRLPAGLPAETAENLKNYHKMMVEGELKLVEGLFERISRYRKPVIITAVNDRLESKPIARLADLGIYTYRSPEVGAKVISYLVQYGRYLKQRRCS
ncbi:MAG: CoA-binding protein [Desulfobacterales bacterium]